MTLSVKAIVMIGMRMEKNEGTPHAVSLLKILSLAGVEQLVQG